MIVTFCGHHAGYNEKEVSGWLDTLLPMLIEGGADTFYLGGYGRFDELSAEAVRRKKKRYPNIQSVLILAYPNKKHDPALYDRSIYPAMKGVTPRNAIPKRNDWMVSNSDVVISGVVFKSGGAVTTLAVARRKRKVVLQYPIAGQGICCLLESAD